MNDMPEESNASSHVNSIPGVWIDDDGMVHTEYGSYHPVTGKGLPIDAPQSLMREILLALVRDGEDSGPTEEFDWDAFMAEMGSE